MLDFFDNEIMSLATIKISHYFDGSDVIIWHSFESNYCNNRKLQHFLKIYKTVKRIMLSICYLCVPILSFSLFTVLIFNMKIFKIILCLKYLNLFFKFIIFSFPIDYGKKI